MQPPLSPPVSPGAALGARVAIGVDLAAGRGVTALAALRLARAQMDGETGAASLALLSLSYPADDDAIVADIAAITAEAQAAGAAPVVVGLDAPLTLPAPVVAALRGLPADAPAPSGADSSPYLRAAERDAIWSQLGVRPFPVSFLGGLTFRAIPLAARLRALDADSLEVIEVFPSAAFVALGLLPAQPRRQPRQPKTAPERRWRAQAALTQIISDLPDSAADGGAAGDTPPLGADALDALAAALTAAAALLGATCAIGDPAEGCITLPTRPASDLFAPPKL